MTKERITWAAIIILIISFVGFREWKNNKTQKGLQTMIEVLNDSTQIYKNKENKWESEKKSFNITTAELRKHGQELGFENAGLRKQVGNLKNLVSRLEGDLEIAGEGSIVFSPPDTVYLEGDTVYVGQEFNWTNNYLTLNGTLSNSQELDFNYKYNSTFKITTYWKKPGMFKRKDLVVNFTMSDPNAYTTSLNNVVIKPDPPKFYETRLFWGGVGFLGGLIVSGLTN
jgi:hypothetical protein